MRYCNEHVERRETEGHRKMSGSLGGRKQWCQPGTSSTSKPNCNVTPNQGPLSFSFAAKPHYWALSLFDGFCFFFSLSVCERFVRTRIIAPLLSYLIVDLMVTHQKQNMHNCDSSIICQVQRRVVRAPVPYWKTAILRDVLFMSFETHFHLNRLVQGFRCWRVSEMQMCSGESEM